jgi:Uma2 family endonuclease
MYASILRPDDDELPVDHCVLLRNVPWEAYEALLAARGDASVPRLTYLRGELEILSPAPQHDWVKTTLARLLEHWSFVRNVPIQGYGSTTYRKREKERGLEPDECYIVGRNRGGVPDIALEVVWTSRLLDKFLVYAGLGVPEVWVWRHDTIQVNRLREGHYEPIPRSELLPDVDLELLARLATYEDQNEAVRELHEALKR